MLRWITTAVLAMMLATLAACAEPEGPRTTERLVIETASGDQIFNIEFAETEDERRRGLMFREDLAEDSGMLFDFEDSRVITMWMRNTPLPLDMIFIIRTGRIAHIAENTVPFSEAIISSRYPVSAVLEVNAGTARRLGITTGDLVRHSVFEDAPPAAAE